MVQQHGEVEFTEELPNSGEHVSMAACTNLMNHNMFLRICLPHDDTLHLSFDL
jgi:hypothetical protein